MASKRTAAGWSRVRWTPPTGDIEVTYATFPKSIPYAIKEEILFACQRAVREQHGDEAARTGAAGQRLSSTPPRGGSGLHEESATTKEDP